ncbi:MAG: tRNA preQ1(34) S-adenosylmethionine ribosyltransferase-isomerase QueA [Dehalococcoidales bacterium]|nr:tRNA preQ1(34) S-adenosylmethionine ribosyltransferase-isomerase QueA [Dehalococcoidales bacterium]
MNLKTNDFDYHLPPELIAQTPVEPRDASRLLVVNRADGEIVHRKFTDILDYLQFGDVMVFNDSRVLPARLAGVKPCSGGKVEILLLKRLEEGTWEALVKPAKRLKRGAIIAVGESKIPAEIIAEGEAGIRTIRFQNEKLLAQNGALALPPYIHAPLVNTERYQTVYAHQTGSVAAPTAGLHFTPALLAQIQEKGVKCVFVTLHVGLDTFRPVQEDEPEHHIIHKEYGYIGPEAAAALTCAKAEKKRIIGVGTTSVRMLEFAAGINDLPEVKPFSGWVDLFILPGYRFKLVDAMITNFHLPKSTLLMLVSAFAGKELIDKVYATATKERYRFYSFGDATLIL